MIKTINILIEIGVEEMPYKSVNKISNDIKNLILINLEKKKLPVQKIKNFSTIRRLALLINLHDQNTLNLKEKIKYVIEKTLDEIKFKTKMRWDFNEKTFIRPIRWYILLLDNEIINHSIFGVKSQRKTYGHKSTNNKINIINSDNYENILKTNGHIICDYYKRKAIVLNLIKKFITFNFFNVILKKDSILNITNLVEYPSLIICAFKKLFLKLPEEIITFSVLKNHFCLLLKKNNKLTNKIIIITDTYRKNTNIEKGYTYIINTKLSELQYLYEKEQNYLKTKKLTDLKKLVLNEKLGNMYDKTIRIKNIVIFIKNKLKIKSNNIIIAAKLIKMDLLTKIVTEMPELTGLICSYNIDAPIKVKQYIYKYNQIINNKIKTNLHSSIIALADKIDNIISFFIINKQPSGSKDPFNLRKDAKTITKLILTNKINIDIIELINYSINQHNSTKNLLVKDVLDFIIKRNNYKNEILKLIKNKKNLLKIDLQIKTTENFLKYKFKMLLFNNIKRISKITEKNKISSTIKFKKKLLIKIQEKILTNKIMHQIKIQNILIKNNLFFEHTKTLIKLERDIANYFNSVFILEKNKEIMHNRLKFLNILKRILSSEINVIALISN